MISAAPSYLFAGAADRGAETYIRAIRCGQYTKGEIACRPLYCAVLATWFEQQTFQISHTFSDMRLVCLR